MFQKLVRFFKYHNAVPMIFAALMLGAGGVFAASPEVREAAGEALVSRSETVVSIDNSALLQTNLDQFTPSAQITDITEDDDNYYVSYTLTTLDLADGRWTTVNHGKEMVVAKLALGKNDLGLYVAKQLKEVTDRQLAYLKEVQEIERGRGETPKVVATTYSGLIGKFLDTKEEVFPGYEPVVVPESEPEPSVATNPSPQALPETSAEASVAVSETPTATQSAAVVTSIVNTQSESSDRIPPTLTLLGNNPAKVSTKTAYSDNGVRVSDNKDQNLGYAVKVDGVPVQEISLDTSKIAVYKITYTATDNAGNESSIERTVVVYNQYDLKNPTIALKGSETVEFFVGEIFVDSGAVATDYDDGDLTVKISVENPVETQTVGTYTITYTVSDSDGNAATPITRTVIVKEKVAEE